MLDISKLVVANRNSGQSNMADVEIFKTNSLSLSNLIYLPLNQSTMDCDLQFIDDYYLLGVCLNILDFDKCTFIKILVV